MSILTKTGLSVGIRWTLSLTALVLSLPPSGLAAQPHVLPSSGSDRTLDTTHTISDSAQLATITTDTGAFAPWRPDFTRFNSLLFCHAAARLAARVGRRSLASKAGFDTMTDYQQDTLPVAVVALARRCGAAFTVATAVPQDLSVLFDLALQEGNDSLALAVQTRRLTLVTTPLQRDSLQWTVLDDVLRLAEPAHVVLAESLVAHLDARGLPALRDRLIGHEYLRRYWAPQHWLGWGAVGNPANERRECEQIIGLRHQLPASRRNALMQQYTAATKNPFNDGSTNMSEVVEDWPGTWSGQALVVNCYRVLIQQARLTAPDSVAAIVRRALADSIGINMPGDPNPGYGYRVGTRLDSLAHYLDVNNTIQTYQHRVLPPLRADYWFPAAGATLPPARGKVSLVVGLDPIWELDRGGMWWRPGLFFFEASYHEVLVAQIRRWLAQYGAAGLAVTIVVPTHGYSWAGDLEAPRDEAEHLRWFYQDYLALPVSVAVRVSQFAPALPAPDGRRAVVQTPPPRWSIDSVMDDDAYHGVYSWVVIGREGQYLLSGNETSGRAGGYWLPYDGGSPQERELLLRYLFSPAPAAQSAGPPVSDVAPPAMSARSSSTVLF